MAADWRETTLGGLLSFSNGRSSPLRSEGLPNPVFGSNGIIGFADEANAAPSTIVVGRVGSYCGSLHFSSASCWVTDNAIQATAIDENDARFLFYLLSTLRLNDRRAGSGQPLLNQSILSSIPVVIPAPNEQRTIAHVLGTLDDKIELNRRMNETLEATARALFKSWFIDFDPVRAKMAGRDPGLPQHLADLFPDCLVDSELGPIPEGWEVKALSSFGKVITGKTPSTRNPQFYENDVPFLKIPDMHGKMYVMGTSTMLSRAGADSQTANGLPPGSISVSCIATPGLVVLNHRETHTNQQINSIIPNDGGTSKYLYWSCRKLASEIMLGGSGGSVFHNMNKSTFSALKILDAGLEVISSFEKLVCPMHEMVLSKEKQNHTLIALRDVLLPKLVSGQLRVERAEHFLLSDD